MQQTQSVFDFEAKNLQGETVKLSDYRGKVLLVVNTASACAFTPQYRALEDLYRRYGGQGLVVLGFPCNQFGEQEPGSAQEIGQFCDARFNVTFPLFDKVDVNGAQAIPLFQFLKQQAPGLLGSRAIKWNFTKFLVGRDGRVLHRYAPLVPPQLLARRIRKLLA
jgi:glutathione peroxidase